MNLPIASQQDSLHYKSARLPFRGLSIVNINFERRVITYELNVDTALQGAFVENEMRRGAIVYDKETLNAPCVISIIGVGNFDAMFFSYVYNPRKNKYQCIIVQPFHNEEMKEVTEEDSKFSILDLS